MCEIDSFIYEFKLIYTNIFISKLPYPLSTSIREIWKSQPEELGDTLAGVIQILYEEIRNQCLEREKIKNLNLGSTSLCFNKLELDLPGSYTIQSCTISHGTNINNGGFKTTTTVAFLSSRPGGITQ